MSSLLVELNSKVIEAGALALLLLLFWCVLVGDTVGVTV